MTFTASQKSGFIAALRGHGWELRGTTLCSPSGKIEFGEPYFENWTPEQMRTTFTRRAGMIESAALEDWERTANECRQVSNAAQYALTEHST
jgi:hypothetical protein